jgi:hypothetical protein
MLFGLFAALGEDVDDGFNMSIFSLNPRVCQN